MIANADIAREVAEILLDKKAVILRPDAPFTWASGWKSPIYCDNRLLLSYPDARLRIKTLWSDLISERFKEANALAGVATAGIAHAALLADALRLPMAYVRSKPKEHGTGRQIEGRLADGAKVLVIEDLVSTAMSSMQAIAGLKQEPGVHIVGLMSIFTYGFPKASEVLEAGRIKYEALCDYNTLIDVATQQHYIDEAAQESLSNWRTDPAGWGK